MEPLTLTTFTQHCSRGKTEGIGEEGKNRRDQQQFWSWGQRSRHIQPLGNGNGWQVAPSPVGGACFPPLHLRTPRHAEQRRQALPLSPLTVPPCCCSQTCPGSRDILLNACHSATRIYWPLLWHQQTRPTHTHSRTHVTYSRIQTCFLLNIFYFIKYSCHRGRRWWRREYFLGLFVCHPHNTCFSEPLWDTRPRKNLQFYISTREPPLGVLQ